MKDIHRTLMAYLTFAGCAGSSGNGGYLNGILMETNATQFASKTMRLHLFNAVPTVAPADNAAMLMDWDDRLSRIGYYDVTMDAVAGSSDTVIGMSSPYAEYVCASGDTSVYGVLETRSAITAAAAGGVFNIKLKLVQL